jgi:hypothetical protein
LLNLTNNQQDHYLFKDFIPEEYHSEIDFRSILLNALYLNNLQSCNSKEELKYYIKPKENIFSLADKFIRYGTKTATRFIIIDIDNNSQTLEKFSEYVKCKLDPLNPNWISKTDNGFHIGFILDKPIYLNNDIQTKKAKEIKTTLTEILNADPNGSHRLIGWWRNPLQHQSILNLELHNLDNMYKKLKIEDSKEINSHNETNTKHQISDWKKIDKKEFVKGNRNNFLFKKVVGMLYNGLITNNEILTTLTNINDGELDDNEILKIANSIEKYNITPTQNKSSNKPNKRGIYSQDLWDNNIHNYTQDNNIQFERQRFGQIVTTISTIEKTLNKLLNGYISLHRNHKIPTNKNIAQSSNLSIRTVQRYRNEKKVEKALKAMAFKMYLKNIIPKGVMPTVTPINIILEDITFSYTMNNKKFKFKRISANKLDFFPVQDTSEKLIA